MAAIPKMEQEKGEQKANRDSNHIILIHILPVHLPRHARSLPPCLHVSLPPDFLPASTLEG
jgi:hypothetical protein